MEDEFKKVIFSLALVESEFRRKGFDKEMGNNACLYVALANRIICAVDDLNDIRSKQGITIAKEVRKRVAEIEKKMREEQERELKTLEKIKKEIDKDKPKIKVIPKTTKKVVKKVKVKVKDE
jgi:flagellar motility protein MotE (MotC chaperone)